MSEEGEDKLPQGWAACCIGDVVAHDGFFVDGDWVESKDQDPDGDVRLIQLADVGDGRFHDKSARFLTKKKAEELRCTFLQNGDLLVARMPDPLGRCCIFPLDGDEKYVTVVDVCAIRLGSSPVDPKYMMYLINGPKTRGDIEALKSGSTRKRISRSNLSSIRMPLPPAKEQSRIVAKVEELFSELDKGIESLTAARQQLKMYRHSILKQAFEGKLTRQWREEHAQSLETADQLVARIVEERKAYYDSQLEDWKRAQDKWEAQGKAGLKPKRPLKPKEYPGCSSEELAAVPFLPQSWQWRRLGEIGLVGTGVTPLKSNAEYYERGEIPWITSGALNEPFVREPSGFVTEKAYNNTNLRLYPRHTLVVALYGEGKTRGKCSELLLEATTNQAIAAIVQNGIASKLRAFLKWFLTKNYEAIRLGSSGGVQPNLNLGVIEHTLVPVCSVAEAELIVEELEEDLSVVDRIESGLVSRIQQCQLLRTTILKRALSGELVEQDPDDEPASVLLERIRAEKEAQDQMGKSGSARKKVNKKRTAKKAKKAKKAENRKDAA